MRRCIYISAVFLFVTVSAIESPGADWVFYYANTSYQRMFFDAEKINKTNNIISVWERTVYDRPESLPDGRKVKEIRVLHEINCSSRTLRIIEIVQYLTDGKLDTAVSKDSRADDVAPGSRDERLLKAVCEYAGA